MEYIQGNIAGNEKGIDVVSLNDWHIGSSACNLDLVERTIEYIKETNARAIINGDLIENGTRNSVGSGVYEQILNPQEQIDYLIELLYPIKNNIDMATIGNHEERTNRDLGIDPMKIICDRLGIKYVGYRGVVTYSINKNCYPIFAWHGAYSGKTIATIERRLKEMSNVVEDCSIYLIGHYHKKFHAQRKVNRVDPFNKKIRSDEVHFVCSSSTMNTAKYAEMMGMEEQIPAQAVMKLSGKRREKKIEIDWIE